MGKRSSSSEYLIYCSVKAIAAFFRFLPAGAALWIGRLFGRIAYCFDLRHRAMAYANLKVAFSASKSSEELRRITRDVFEQCGQNIVETLRLPRYSSENYREVVEIEGEEYVHDALRRGKGILFVAMHFGNWELASLACASLGPYKLVAKPQTKMAKLDELLIEYRKRAGVQSLSKGMETRSIIRTLRANGMIGIVVDQGGKDGVLLPFFGKTASLSVGAIKIGLKMDVPLCFCVINRKKDARHRLRIYPPISLSKTGELNKDVETNLAAIVKLMENNIRQSPSEYNWFYKIWKYSTESTTLILNDGRTGHLRQSQAVANALNKALSERGVSSTIKTVEVKFRNAWAVPLLSLAGVWANRWFFQGRADCLKMFLSRETYRELMSQRADFVVSCGSSMAGLNYLLTMDHKAKNIVVLKPGLLDFRKFGLVILPRHDKPKDGNHPGRIVYTRVAPNLIDQQYLQEQAELFLKRFSHVKQGYRKRIGLLLGGDTRQYALSEQTVKMVINQLKGAAEELNAELLVTTSRRTPVKIEQLLLRELKKYERCDILIIANKNNVPEAVGGILGVSDILVVSGDSISMISEAVSAGKNTIIFPLQNLNGRAKHKYALFAEILNDEGYALAVKANDLGRFVIDVARNKIKFKTISEQDTILKEIRKII